MKLDNSQIFIAFSTLLALVFTVCIYWLNPNSLYYEEIIYAGGELKVAFDALVLPLSTLVFAIARLARHRFFSAQDIDASMAKSQSAKALALQAQIQNTLEQFVIAGVCYPLFAKEWGLLFLGAVPLCGIAFFVGRIFFFLGYERGAKWRAFGFALTFLPNAFMAIALLFDWIFGLFLSHPVF